MTYLHQELVDFSGTIGYVDSSIFSKKPTNEARWFQIWKNKLVFDKEPSSYMQNQLLKECSKSIVTNKPLSSECYLILKRN